MSWLILSPPQYKTYVAAWTIFCLLALGILLADRKRVFPELSRYIRFLSVPWKLIIFLPALVFVTFAGHFTDDETWDVVTGAGMSILTFATAPYALGCFYQACKRKRPVRYIIVSIALCLFSSSWFYDGYLLWRDGYYSSRWFGNLLLSPIIYIAAGLLWNLETKGKAGFTLSFLRSSWPNPPVNKGFLPLLWIMIPLIFIAVFELLAFVGWHFK